MLCNRNIATPQTPACTGCMGRVLPPRGYHPFYRKLAGGDNAHNRGTGRRQCVAISAPLLLNRKKRPFSPHLGQGYSCRFTPTYRCTSRVFSLYSARSTYHGSFRFSDCANISIKLMTGSIEFIVPETSICFIFLSLFHGLRPGT